MHSGQLQCSSVIPQKPHFEQQKYSPTGLHSAISPFGALNSEPHLPSFRYDWFSSTFSFFSKYIEYHVSLSNQPLSKEYMIQNNVSTKQMKNGIPLTLDVIFKE